MNSQNHKEPIFNARGRKVDLVLLAVTSAIVVFGIIMLASASAKLSQENFGNTYYYLGHQILWGILPGIIFGYLASRINLNLLKRWALYIFFANIVLMLLVFVPKIGFASGGAARWIALGPLSFQPSEFLKLSAIIYVASWLGNRTQKKSPQEARGLGKTLFPFLIILGFLGAIFYMQPDISTFLLLAAVLVIMYFLAETPVMHTIILIFGGGGGVVFLAVKEAYRLNRINVFLNPRLDPMGIGYQIKQALIAVGSGGLFGVGLGMSRQKYGFLPESMSDSIFAVLAEETGFIGCLIVISLFLAFLWRGFLAATKSSDMFQKLLAAGITSWILIQSLINISAMTGIFPLTGIPLPFFSYGGSAIIAELTAVGLLLNVSRQKS